MLPRSLRVTRQHAIQQYLKQGQRLYSCPAFLVLAHPNTVLPNGPVFGFVISKKVHKRAVIRNRIKRQLRALVRYHFLQIGDKLPVDNLLPQAYLFIVRSAAVDASYETLAQYVQTLVPRCINPGKGPVAL